MCKHFRQIPPGPASRLIETIPLSIRIEHFFSVVRLIFASCMYWDISIPYLFENVYFVSLPSVCWRTHYHKVYKVVAKMDLCSNFYTGFRKWERPHYLQKQYDNTDRRGWRKQNKWCSNFSVKMSLDKHVQKCVDILFHHEAQDGLIFLNVSKMDVLIVLYKPFDFWFLW